MELYPHRNSRQWAPTSQHSTHTQPVGVSSDIVFRDTALLDSCSPSGVLQRVCGAGDMTNVWQWYDEDTTMIWQWVGRVSAHYTRRVFSYFLHHWTQSSVRHQRTSNVTSHHLSTPITAQHSTVQYLMYGWIQFNIDFAHRLSIIFEPRLR